MLHAAVGGVERLSRIRQQFLTAFGQHYPVGVSLEQLRSEFRLKLLYLLRKRTLRDVKVARCLRKVEQFGSFVVIFPLS